MEEKYRLLLAIGNEKLEEEITKIPEVVVIDRDADIEIITDILNYETVDFIIVNTVLSEEKSLTLARQAKEKQARVIALVESHQKNKELIAGLAGAGVKAFVEFNEIWRIADYVRNYPDIFDFGTLQESSGSRSDSTPRHVPYGLSLLRKAKRDRPQTSGRGVKIIGITGAERGAGVTTLCVDLARSLIGSGGRVAILEKTERDELPHVRLPGIDVYTSNLGKIELIKYNYIIIDFGVFFELGKISGMATIVTERSAITEYEQKTSIDRNYCSRIICVCPAAPWKLYKTDFLVNNIASADDTKDWILLFHGNPSSEEFGETDFMRMRKTVASYENTNYLEEIKTLIQ